MHIIHLVTRLLRAGSEENTIETCKWQVKTGHKVTLIHGREVDRWWQDNPIPGVDLLGVPQMVHPTDPLADMQALRALRVIYRRLQPDVIHTHQSKAGILGRLAARAVPRSVVAHTIHIVPFQGVSRTKQTLYIAAEKLAARRTDVFIGVSNAMGHAYSAAGITQPGQVHCVRSGMDLDRFRTPDLPHDWRSLLRLRQGIARPRVALMLAAFEPRKRHLEFLRAFARTAHTLPDLKLLLAGTGPEQARVRAAVQDLLEMPSVSEIMVGTHTEFTDPNYPSRAADEYVSVPGITDPDAFAARIHGDSMESTYREGDIVVFSPLSRARDGSDCFIRFEHETEFTFRRVYFETDAEGQQLVRLQPLNNRYPPKIMQRGDIEGMYTAVYVMRALGTNEP